MEHCRIRIPVRFYDLDLTLQSGQVFRWIPVQDGWEGVVGSRWVRLHSSPEDIQAETAVPTAQWSWLTDYLQTPADLDRILATFPSDQPMQASVAACRGLRLLRQDPWECLASFLLSSCKQIVQIQQMIAILCQRYGTPIPVPPGHAPAFAFPSPQQLARRTEGELRACKLGWRARFLLETSRVMSGRESELPALLAQPLEQARHALRRLPGVGPKIADCVLLFAGGFPEAFPVDVWVERALRQLYFPKQRPTALQLRQFTRDYFGPYAGYAQQYLFHYVRTQAKIGRLRTTC